MSDDTFCKKHQCPHNFGFMHEHWCPKCEEELHGSKKQSDPDKTVDLELDFDLDFTMKDKWESKYGKFIRLHSPYGIWFTPITTFSTQLRELSFPLNLKAITGIELSMAGFPARHSLFKWHDSIAKVWPV